MRHCEAANEKPLPKCASKADGRTTLMGTRTKQHEDQAIRWLLEGDPAIRWQVHRDVVASSKKVIAHERQKVGLEGWGSRLLGFRDSEGTWGGGLYNPKWTSTTYTLLALRDFGLSPCEATLTACRILLDKGLCPDGGVNFGADASETCITGMTLSVAAYFECDDHRVDVIADHLVGQQMPDGGWNCRRRRGATHSSVHTTISVLEGLRAYELQRRTSVNPVRMASAAAANSCWPTDFSSPIARARRLNPSSSSSYFRRVGITTCSAHWITSRRSMLRGTRG